MTEPESPERIAGKEMMGQVYGWEIGDVHGDFLSMTVDHLFGEIWTREGFTIRERRLLLIGYMVGAGLDDVAGLQLDAALRLEELSPAQLRELVIFLAHYAGWPTGAKLNTIVEEMLGRAAAAARDAADPDLP